MSSKKTVKVINGRDVTFVARASVSPVQSSITCNGGVPGGRRPRIEGEDELGGEY